MYVLGPNDYRKERKINKVLIIEEIKDYMIVTNMIVR